MVNINTIINICLGNHYNLRPMLKKKSVPFTSPNNVNHLQEANLNSMLLIKLFQIFFLSNDSLLLYYFAFLN